MGGRILCNRAYYGIMWVAASDATSAYSDPHKYMIYVNKNVLKELGRPPQNIWIASAYILNELGTTWERPGCDSLYEILVGSPNQML